MTPLSPGYAVGGGLLIGSAAALLLVLSGRIAGVSGIAAVAARIADKGPPWLQAASFVIALPLGALLVSATLRTPHIEVTSSIPVLTTAGLFVGFGTRLGTGCTGFCPGPALAALGFGLWQAWLFVAAMLARMVVHLLYENAFRSAAKRAA
jgi:uncharacterized protein